MATPRADSATASTPVVHSHVVSGYPPHNLHGQIVQEIGRRIVSGEIRPGDALPPPTRPASRTAVREAVRVLAAKGLVESRPKTGTRVRPRQAWNLLDADVLAWQQQSAPRQEFLRRLTEVRRIIEPAAAGLAAERADAATVAALDAAFRDMSAALRGDEADVEAFAQADMRFHLTILRACGNDLLEQMSRVVYSPLILSFRATSRLPGRAKAALPKHRAILEAIRAGQARRAGEAMRRLVQSTAREVEALRPSARVSR